MDTKTRWKYIFLAVYAFVVVVVGAYLLVLIYFHVPLESLLPLHLITKNKPSLSANSAVQQIPVVSSTKSSETKWYLVKGKFVTKPVYDNSVLRSDFVIDGDPAGHKIPVSIYQLVGKVYIARFKGNLNGEPDWQATDMESLRNSIKVNSPVVIRVLPIMEKLSPYDLLVEKVMDGIRAGDWSIPGDFQLSTRFVGVAE